MGVPYYPENVVVPRNDLEQLFAPSTTSEKQIEPFSFGRNHDCLKYGGNFWIFLGMSSGHISSKLVAREQSLKHVIVSI